MGDLGPAGGHGDPVGSKQTQHSFRLESERVCVCMKLNLACVHPGREWKAGPAWTTGNTWSSGQAPHCTSAMTSFKYVPNLHDSCYVVSYDCVVCACRAFLGTQVTKAPRETKGLRGSRAREDGPDL